MEKNEYDEFLKNNPALYDFEKEGSDKIINGFFDRFKEIYKLETRETSLSNDEFAFIFSGPRVTTIEGYENYPETHDIVSLAFKLYSRLPLDERKEKINDLLSKLVEILPSFNSSKSIYDSFISAFNNYKVDDINVNDILRILSKARYPMVNQDINFQLFCDFFNITSVGQLLNYDIAIEYRTKIIYSEIMKGLREDKINGIPVDDIMDFFTNPRSSSIILENFDVNSLIIDFYVMLYNVRSIEKYIENQVRNLDLRYTILNGDKEKSEPNNNDVFIFHIRQHYDNVQKIFDSLVNLAISNGAIKYYTLAYLIIYAPPESFLVSSSYNKVIELYRFFIMGKTANGQKDNDIKNIILLLPNIDLPKDVLDIFSTDENKKYLAEGLKLGFLRYALHVTDKIAEVVLQQFGKGYFDSEQKSDLDYVNMSYIERIQYLISDEITNQALITGSEDDTKEKEETVPSVIFNCEAYKESNFRKTFEYINELVRDFI
jgi:hypothetical protein